MACNSSYVATVDNNCWLSSENSPLQTMCAHMEEELLRRSRIAANRCFVRPTKNSIAGCTLHWETMYMVP